MPTGIMLKCKLKDRKKGDRKTGKKRERNTGRERGLEYPTHNAQDMVANCRCFGIPFLPGLV